MNVEDMAVAVRERRMPELYDLCMLLLRRHFRGLMGLFLPLVLALATCNWWLLSDHHETEWAVWWPAWLLLAAEAPLVAAVAMSASSISVTLNALRPSRGGLSPARGVSSPIWLCSSPLRLALDFLVFSPLSGRCGPASSTTPMARPAASSPIRG